MSTAQYLISVFNHFNTHFHGRIFIVCIILTTQMYTKDTGLVLGHSYFWKQKHNLKVNNMN